MLLFVVEFILLYYFLYIIVLPSDSPRVKKKKKTLQWTCSLFSLRGIIPPICWILCAFNKVLIARFVKGSASYFRLVLFVVTHFVLKFMPDWVVIINYSDCCSTHYQKKGGISLLTREPWKGFCHLLVLRLEDRNYRQQASRYKPVQYSAVVLKVASRDVQGSVKRRQLN